MSRGRCYTTKDRVAHGVDGRDHRGAVHRLRPKLMTEGVANAGLMPMLWATGVGAEVMRPMVAPVLGGLLVADEVIDLLLPVVFNWYQPRRWKDLHGAGVPATG